MDTTVLQPSKSVQFRLKLDKLMSILVHFSFAMMVVLLHSWRDIKEWNWILKLSCIQYYLFITHELWVSIIIHVSNVHSSQSFTESAFICLEFREFVVCKRIYSADGEMFLKRCLIHSPTCWQSDDTNVLTDNNDNEPHWSMMNSCPLRCQRPSEWVPNQNQVIFMYKHVNTLTCKM